MLNLHAVIYSLIQGGWLATPSTPPGSAPAIFNLVNTSIRSKLAKVVQLFWEPVDALNAIELPFHVFTVIVSIIRFRQESHAAIQVVTTSGTRTKCA